MDRHGQTLFGFVDLVVDLAWVCLMELGLKSCFAVEPDHNGFPSLFLMGYRSMIRSLS